MINEEIKQSAIHIFELSIEVTEKTAYDCICEFHGITKQLNVSAIRKKDKRYKPIINYCLFLNQDPYQPSKYDRDKRSLISILTEIKQELSALLATANMERIKEIKH